MIVPFFVMPFAIGPWQIVLVLGVVVLLFGGRKIPEVMRGIGSGIKEFKSATKDDKETDNKEKQSKS